MVNTSTDKIKKKWNVSDIPDLTGKVVIVTGANSGTGYEASKAFTSKNARVIMACRNLDKGKIAVDSITGEYPSASVEIIQLDLADLNSIKKFASEFTTKYDRLDILMNNAGVMQTPEMKTADGFELQFGTNHLGHFALTGLLMDLLSKTENSRVVTMSSAVHGMGKIRFDNIMLENEYGRNKAYVQSKLANLLFAYELQRRLERKNVPVQSMAAHPGYSATNLQKSGPREGNLRMFYWFYKISNVIIAQSAARGALPILCAATDSNVKGGEYIGPRSLRGSRGFPKKVESSKRSYNEEDARKLWEISEELTGVSFLSQ